jgi:capsular exopolysaccharide synthesis family protein
MNDTSEVKLHFLDYWRVIKLRMGLILLTFFLVMVTAGVTTYFLPKEFLSKVTMEVKTDNSGPISPFGQATQRPYDPQFVATQFQILQKTEILYPVIERLDLVKEFSPPGQRLPLQQVFFRLKRSMQLQEVRNTGLIEIGVFDTDAQRATNIANTVAIVYQEKRRSEMEKNVGRGLSQLQDEVEKQRKFVEDAALKAMQIRARDGILDPDPDKEGSNIGREEQSMTFVGQQLSEQQLRVLELDRQAELINALRPDELMQVLRELKIEDATVLKTLPLWQDAGSEEARLLAAGLGENHRRLKEIRAQRESYTKTLSDQLTSIRNAQAHRLRFERDKLAVIEKTNTESQANSIQAKTKVSDYIGAKNQYIQARKILESLETTVAAEKVKIQVLSDTAKIWEKAEKSEFPAKPNVPAYMALAALVGLIIGVGLAFFIEYLDTSVKTLDDVERYLQIPVLAVIPKDVSILMKNQGDSPDAEAYRILRAAVEFNKPFRDANTFTLISGGPGEGKSTTLNNLAFTCAKGGYNVLVVDADLRRATQHEFFDTDNNFGLTDYLLGRAEVDEIIKTTKIDNLSFIPSGHLPGEAVGILNSQRMTEMIAKVKSQYDLVFFDSPPILGVSDGSVLASEVDMTIMVVQHRRFPRSMLQRVKQAVLNVGGRLIGVVLNNVDAKHDDGYSYYNNYNEYYGVRREAPKIEAPATPQLARPRPASREDY